MALDLYHALGQINKIKRKELVLPIAKKEVVISPLSVGDDLSIKTALMSPVKSDRELLRLLWQHTEFWHPNPDSASIAAEPNEGVNGIQGIPKGRRKKKAVDPGKTGGVFKKIPEQQFYNNVSYFDKLVLLWGVYQVTYESLGTREIECPNCGNKYNVDIYVEDTMHEDSMRLFEPEVPFNKYSFFSKVVDLVEILPQ